MHVMTSAEIRRSFLEFFRSKEHTLVPSSSLLPDSPNLLFTNAGMNQFVPIFLGERKADVDRWAGAVPSRSTRAADTQKCIRAGGKHNDLEDVGLDTYHHTFFEMLGNWSFGDYFKKEAIDWAWELITQVWKFPAHRVYATVYQPDPTLGDPAEFDQEAWDLWAVHFRAAGLDPAVHIVPGNKKDNFWMMGDTGPCGPCSELHIDLTPAGDTRGALVNKGTAECIEIWNLVFIQFNANPDGTFSPLPARHVDTGMGFERVAAIIQGTRGFTEFANARISNYETDVFRPIFSALEQVSGHRYGSTLPQSGSTGDTEQERVDVAFRVIADHLRTLSFAVADGILPGNSDRHYVLRRILRRAVRYGRSLGLKDPFFYRLVPVLADSMGEVFPEIRTRKAQVEEVLRMEEEAFHRTLDKGLALFQEAASAGAISGQVAFKLYDEQGFPLDLTQLLARERGLAVDSEGFDRLMEEQRARARASQKRQVIELSQLETQSPTRFIGFDQQETNARVLEVVQIKDRTAVVLDTTPCYAEMGGQVGDTGELTQGGRLWRIGHTQKSGETFLHLLDTSDAPATGAEVNVRVDAARRAAVARHHTVTHLLHWALHEVVSRDATQKGSFVGPDKLTFDFNHAPLTASQVADVERLVNQRILENAPVSWTEVPYADIRGRAEVMQFFGEKYGDQVRVVQIGGQPAALNGYSMELCGGTHVRATGEIGLFRLVSENAIAAGVRRIEALSGAAALEATRRDRDLIQQVAGRLNAPVHELEKKLEALLAHQKELEKTVLAARQREASNAASGLRGSASDCGGVPVILHNLGGVDGDFLQAVAEALKGSFSGVVVLGGMAGGAASLVATVSPEFTKRIQAGKVIQNIAPLLGGRGGGKPDFARGGGKDVSQLNAALEAARTLISGAS
jgi:alanyl-tRNA synthetase